MDKPHPFSGLTTLIYREGVASNGRGPCGWVCEVSSQELARVRAHTPTGQPTPHLHRDLRLNPGSRDGSKAPRLDGQTAFIKTPISQHENPAQLLCSNSSVHFTCAHTWICAHIGMRTDWYAHRLVCTHIDTSTHGYEHTWICVHVGTRTHWHAYTLVCTHPEHTWEAPWRLPRFQMGN